MWYRPLRHVYSKQCVERATRSSLTSNTKRIYKDSESTKIIRVDETSVDEIKVDETAVDETGVDEPAMVHKKDGRKGLIVRGCTKPEHQEVSRYQLTYGTYLASTGRLLYTPSVERVVERYVKHSC